MFLPVQASSGLRNRAAGAAPRTRDISGYQIFDQGETGAAHALAHRCLDNGEIISGHRALGKWLDGHSGAGSDWVHLQFHMAIFELKLGQWPQAHARFLAEVLPTAAGTTEALTDAPALLWRIAMTAPGAVSLPWQPLRQTALACIDDGNQPFVQAHNLLALAGANDSAGIERWLQHSRGRARSLQQRLVVQFGEALAALATGSFEQAGAMLEAILPELSAIGGSHAQNGIFRQLADWCTRQGPAVSPRRSYRNAA
jgi:hypothetical protein